VRYVDVLGVVVAAMLSAENGMVASPERGGLRVADRAERYAVQADCGSAQRATAALAEVHIWDYFSRAAPGMPDDAAALLGERRTAPYAPQRPWLGSVFAGRQRKQDRPPEPLLLMGSRRAVC
jgi:hypothetical protein